MDYGPVSLTLVSAPLWYNLGQIMVKVMKGQSWILHA